jgi:4-hydroxybenzoate polyprenyltransferase
MRTENGLNPRSTQTHGDGGALASGSAASSLWHQVPAAIVAMRPYQWTKNLLVPLALIFARRLGDAAALERTVLAFLAFCLAASAVYLVNDLADRERDRLHPVKRNRPLPSGRLTVRAAALTALLCLLGATGLTYWLVRIDPAGGIDPYAAWGGSDALFVVTLASYMALNVAYSTWLKHQVLWDVFIIAAGFVLRAMAGAFAIPVPISPWFYLCTTFLALFLALAKRRAELLRDPENSALARHNLRAYSMLLLDQLIGITVTATLITYSLYTFQGENASHALMLTIPLVLFGIFRYLYLVYARQEGERPDELLWRDPQILGAVATYAALVFALLYAVPHLRG